MELEEEGLVEGMNGDERTYLSIEEVTPWVGWHRLAKGGKVPEGDHGGDLLLCCRSTPWGLSIPAERGRGGSGSAVLLLWIDSPTWEPLSRHVVMSMLTAAALCPKSSTILSPHVCQTRPGSPLSPCNNQHGTHLTNPQLCKI